MSKNIPVTITITLECNVSNSVQSGVLQSALVQRLVPKLNDVLWEGRNPQLHDFGEGNAEINSTTIVVLEHPEGSINIGRGG